MYGCNCSECNTEKETLSLGLKNKFKPLLKTVEKAFKKLHKKGNYKPEDLDNVKEYKELIYQTNNILSRAFEDNDLSEGMLESLQNDVFLFSGIKSHSQLLEASRQLLTNDKKIKSFAQFNNDVRGIKESHRKYLEAEYEFAVGSIQMAERWEGFSNSDRYYLQYRTANDNKVRDTHAVLHNVTLPKSHPFWLKYFAPNGWRCRCLVVQVLAHSNKISDEKKALLNGAKATTQIGKNGKNKLDIFRFNPGIKKIVFPPKHPYNKVAGATKVKPIILAIVTNNERKKQLQKTYSTTRKKHTKTVKTERFGKILINKKSFDKTQNINAGNYNNQIDSLNEIPHLKEHLNKYKGAIKLQKVKNTTKAKKKPNIIGYVEITTKNKKFKVGLEKDNSVKEDYKLYYIKKVTNSKG